MGQVCSPDESQGQTIDTEVKPTGAPMNAPAYPVPNSEVPPQQPFVPTKDLEADRVQLRKLIREQEETLATLTEDLNTIRSSIREKNEAMNKQNEQLDEASQALREANQRVSKLKLQSELRDKELKNAQQNLEENVSKTKTMIEGKMLKFGRGGKLNPKQKWVWFHVLDNGLPILDWSDNVHSSSVNRLIVNRVFTNESLVTRDFYKDRVFAVETYPNVRKDRKKVLVFAAADQEECRRWFHVMQRAVADAPKTEIEQEPHIFELTFDKRPFKFGVDIDITGTKLLVTSIQDKELGLVEGVQVVSCNDTNFEGQPHHEMINALCYTDPPLTIRFAATPEQLRGLDIDTDALAAGKSHRRELSMAELYPAEEYAVESPISHPLVKDNEEFKQWLKNPAFKELMEGLIADPQKLTEFITKDDI